ncbi:MAG TPA: hypothetical protein VK731_10255 [Candidatus Cybelea sp.]|jgi:hypothetical protein|nr:hypothetical protein [Candidatus Cybelea sp.]
MDNLISLIIDLLTALFSGSKKDKPDNSSAQANRPDPSRPRVPQRPTAWEEELRRLLDGQSQPSPAPPPARQPATLVPQTPRVITAMTPPPPIVTRPVPAYSPVPVVSPPPLPSGFTAQSQPLASLSESRQAYDRASQLDKTAASRIERVPGQEVQLTAVIRRPVSPEVMQVVALFKSPSAARQAVIASVIFGPPRAFEEQTCASF